MKHKIDELRKVVAEVGAEIPVERLETINDLVSRREETLALELLIDNLWDFEVVCTPQHVRLLKTIAKSCRVDSGRVESIDELGWPSTVRGGETLSSTMQSTFQTLLKLPTAEEFVREAKANQIGRLLIVRALRREFGMSFEEAVTLAN